MVTKGLQKTSYDELLDVNFLWNGSIWRWALGSK